MGCDATNAALFDAVRRRVKAELGGAVPGLTWDTFAAQLLSYLRFGESMLSATIQFEANDDDNDTPASEAPPASAVPGSPPALAAPVLPRLLLQSEVVSNRPRVRRFPSLLTAEETAFLRACVAGKLKPSPHGGGIYTGDAALQAPPFRTSEASFLKFIRRGGAIRYRTIWS